MITTIESSILGYQKHLADLEPKPIDNSRYSSWVQEYVKMFSAGSIDFCIKAIMSFLGEYVKTIHKMKEPNRELFEKVKAPDPLLSDIDWVVDTIIKGKNYQRLELPSVEKLDGNLSRDIALKALKMPYEDSVNFMGEIIGAWVLTYPGDSIKKYEKYIDFRKQPSEDKYIYALVRLIEVEFMEWRK